MKDEICRSCIDCAVTRCDNHTSNRPYPAFCVSKQVSDAQRKASLQQYLTDEEDRKLAQVAAGIESDGYRKWPRVQETILFAKRMGYHKIGIATCVALIRESRTLAKMLRANGFEVFGVGCKTGEIFKTALGIDAAHQGPGPVACNPVLQDRAEHRHGPVRGPRQSLLQTRPGGDHHPGGEGPGAGPQPRDGPVHRRWVLF